VTNSSVTVKDELESKWKLAIM